ncbi:WD repeat-containing protein 97 [Pleurodeles waltl]|uniref:WD repeat-containing protein 97 n=1 Tax=Pleurodeles waltl TaxID=8319 RepID=UPI0037096C0B
MTSHTLEQWETSDCRGSAMSTNTYCCSTTTSRLTNVQESPQEKAKRLWAMLRNGITSAVIKVKKSDLKSLQITHGLEHQRHVIFKDRVLQVIYSHQRKGFVSLDATGRIHLHQQDGRITNSFQPNEPLTGLLHVSRVNQYVAWYSDTLKVLSTDFAVISTIQTSHEICCATYNQQRNEVVTGGTAYIAIWHFRVGFRQMVCQKVMSQGFNECDVVSMVVLERTLLQSQKCFAVCDNSVAVFNLSDGALITFRRALHLRPITGIVYSDAAKLLVTSSGTSIKVWDENWNIRTIFVGHTGPVTALALHHVGTLFFSASLDGTIRTWDLETADQVDEVQVKEDVLGLVMHGEGHNLVSYSSFSMDQWQVKHLYDLFAIVGSQVTEITTVDLSQKGSFPIRALCICKDSALRLLSVDTANVICTLLLDKPTQVAAVDYCLPLETLFVLTDHGHLLKVNTLTNPMSVVKQLPPTSASPRFSCLKVYSFIMDYNEAFSYWTKVVEQKGERRPRSRIQLSLSLKEKNRYLLIVGCDDGTLRVLEWYSWQTQCQVKAHNFGRVTGIISSPQNDYIISAGSDLTIKVWRVFPYADESLSLENTFYCSYPVVHMCTMASLLIVAFQDPSTATYSIVQYNLHSMSRADHRPGDDPHDDITGLCCCPRLKIFASSSRDGSVKIWNHENQLVRHINLSAVPESLAFGGNQVDLLVGIQRHIYRIDLAKNLPILYQVKLACIEVRLPVPDPPVPIPEISLQTLPRDSQKRLVDPHSAIMRSQVSLLQNTEEEGVNAEEKETYASFAARDQELLLIQEGKLHSSKKPKRTKATEKAAFERYLRLFYSDRPRIKIPKVDPFDIDDLLRPPPSPPNENPYNPVKVKGFFPDPLEALNQCLISQMYQVGGKNEKLPIPPYGFIPNSVLVRLLWPQQMLQEQFVMEEKMHRELVLPELQAKLEKESDLWEGFMLDHENDRELHRLQEKEEKLENKEERKRALMKMIDSVPVKENLSSLLPPVLSPKPEELPTPSSPEEKVDRTKMKGTRPVHSRIPRPPDFKVSLPPLPSKQPSSTVEIKAESPPPPPPSPTLPPPSPTPGFILQFQHKDWFQVLFPDFGPETFSKTITVAEFVSQLLQGLKLVNFPMKVGIIDAILLLHEQEGFPNVREVHDALISALNLEIPLNLQVQDQRNFILATLGALKTLDCNSKELALELMTFFQQATLELRTPLMALFEELGLQDRKGHFYKEMDSWETWKDTDGSKSSLKDFCNRWLDEWMEKLQAHVARILQSLPQKPQRVRAGRRLLPRKKGRVPKVQTQGTPLTGTISQFPDSHKIQAQGTSPTGTISQFPDSQKIQTQGTPLTGTISQFLDSQKIQTQDTALTGTISQFSDSHKIQTQDMSLTGTISPFPDNHKDHDTKPEPESTPLEESSSSQPLQSRKDKTSKLDVRPAGQPDPCLDLSPMEAINYFCEVQNQNELQALRLEHEPNTEDGKDTVVALPPIDRRDAILRLGETHSMFRTRKSEHFYLPPIPQQNLLSGFGRYINLPVKKINLNPFPSVLDLHFAPGLIASLSQMTHRYFFLEHSILPGYTAGGHMGPAAKLRQRYSSTATCPVPPHT